MGIHDVDAVAPLSVRASVVARRWCIHGLVFLVFKRDHPKRGDMGHRVCLRSRGPKSIEPFRRQLCMVMPSHNFDMCIAQQFYSRERSESSCRCWRWISERVILWLSTVPSTEHHVAPYIRQAGGLERSRPAIIRSSDALVRS